MSTANVAFGAAFASSNEGVYGIPAAEVRVVIAVSAREPNFACSVCKNALAAGACVIAAMLPSVTFDTLGVVVRKMASNETPTPPLAVPAIQRTRSLPQRTA